MEEKMSSFKNFMPDKIKDILQEAIKDKRSARKNSDTMSEVMNSPKAETAMDLKQALQNILRDKIQELR